jgi:urea transport system permease protein
MTLLASRSQQATLLQQWAIRSRMLRLPLLRGAETGKCRDRPIQTRIHTKRRPAHAAGRGRQTAGRHQKSVAEQPAAHSDCQRPFRHRLVSTDSAVRLQAAKSLQRDAQADQLPLLTRRFELEKDSTVHDALAIALANLQLADADPQVRLHAVELLGTSGDPDTQGRLQNLTDPKTEADADVRAAAAVSLKAVQHRLLIRRSARAGVYRFVTGLDPAAGRAGAGDHLRPAGRDQHGARRDADARRLFDLHGAVAVSALRAGVAGEFYPLVALPVAFFITAGIGMALERTVIRHLYGRPLETLLATWGISLILIQLVRVVFGAQNVEVANPAGCPAAFSCCRIWCCRTTASRSSFSSCWWCADLAVAE